MIGLLYSVVVAFIPGVRCKTCAHVIGIHDEYLPGIRGAETAARPYGLSATAASNPWQATLTCPNPDCRQIHTYGPGDLRLLNG